MTIVTAPWLQSLHRRLADAQAANRLPQALLLSGAAGLGKVDFARHMAAAWLCEKAPAAGQFCGQCHGCLMVSQGAHPDLHRLALSEKKKQIGVDSVRAFTAALSLTSGRGLRKVGLIENADVLNRFSANALLKTLEEPPGDTVLLLVSSQPARLPITIRSRCQRLAVAPPEPAIALQWLTQQLGSADQAAEALRLCGTPLAALRLDEQRREALIAAQRLFAACVSGGKDPVSLAAGSDVSAQDLVLVAQRETLRAVRDHIAGNPPSAALRLGQHLNIWSQLTEMQRLHDAPLSPVLQREANLIRLAASGVTHVG